MMDLHDMSREQLIAHAETLQYELDEMRGEGLAAPWGLHMTRKEFALVCALARQAPRVISQYGLLEVVSNGIDQPGIKIVNVYVCRARKQLDLLNLTIRTSWGVGYSMARPDAEAWLRWCKAKAAGQERPYDYPGFEPLLDPRRQRKAA